MSQSSPFAESEVPDKPRLDHLRAMSRSPSRVSSASSCESPGKASPNLQQFCLRWNNYQKNLMNVFDELLQNESFVDVTLACDGNSIKAHKMVLSACSPYFQNLFFDNPCQHPTIIMRDVKWPELKAVVEFMYKGEVKILKEDIPALLRVAEMLKIRGLTDVNTADTEFVATPQRTSDIPEISAAKKQRLNVRSEWDMLQPEITPKSLSPELRYHKKRRSTGEKRRAASPILNPQSTDEDGASSILSRSLTSRNVATPISTPPFAPISNMEEPASFIKDFSQPDDEEIKPGIAEMIREEEKVSRKLLYKLF